MVLFRSGIWKKVRELHYKIPLQPGRGVYSVHFAAHSDGADARVEGARRTVESIKEHAVKNDLPFVLGGDMNATAGSLAGEVFERSGITALGARLGTSIKCG